MAPWLPTHESHDDSDATMNADLSTALVGVVMTLFLIALCALGVPEIRASDYAQLQSELKSARSMRWMSSMASQTARKEADAAKTALREAQQRIEELGKDSKRMTDALKKLRTAPIESVAVAIAVDGSGSMRPVIDELRNCIDILTVVGPALFKRFTLSVVVYRERLTVFPATDLIEKDQRWHHFAYAATERTEINERLGEHSGKYAMLPQFASVTSPADTAAGIRRSLRELPPVDEHTKRVLVVCGDVGPWEGGNLTLIDSGERELAARVVEEVRLFSAQKESTVLTVFTGAATEGMHLRDETRAFFKQLAGTQGRYSELVSDLTREVLRATVPGGQQR